MEQSRHSATPWRRHTDEDKNGDEEEDEEEDAPAATITVADTAPSGEGPELDPPAATPALGGPDTPVPPYME